MNKLTRLTALLLAMLMMFSTFATAETAYQVGGMTVENWQGIVDSAVERLNREIEGGDVYPLPSPPVVDSQPYAETHEVKLSEGSFTMSKADLALVKSEQSGQWQIAVGETVNDQNETVYLWANLAGETGTSLNVTYTMLQNFPYYVIRQVNYDADNQLVQVGMLTFSLTEPTAVMKLNAMARDGETTSEIGDAINEQTSTPWSFERSNDDRLSDIVITYMFDDTAMPVSLRNTKAADDDGIESCVIGGRETNSVANRKIPGYMVSYAVVDGTRVEVGGKIGTDTDNITITQDNVALNGYTIPENDVEIVVYYTSAVVAYTVKSWFEPQNGGSHVQDLDNYPNKTISDNSAALTGHQLTITPDAVPGFQVLYFDEPVLAANGTTSVNVYYNRSWYLMNFDLDGGYGVDPIYAKFGAAIEAPVGEDKEPHKAGYTFQGWDLVTDVNGENVSDGVADDMPSTMLAGNTTYKALWEVEELAKVSVVIWGENANDTDYAYQKTIEIYAKPGSTISFTTGNTVCGYEQHTHNADCYDCGVTAHTHGPDCCTIEAHTHSEACCTIAVHTHGLSCYPNVGTAQEDAPWGAPSGPVNGQIYSANFWGQTYRYIYINGIWYRYTANANNNAVIQPNCGQAAGSHDDHTCVYCNKTEHSHDGANCIYCSQNREEHTHTEECFSCTQKEHTHTSSCYITDPNMASNLWELKTSDTVTVAADGSTVMNVYYDRKEFTLTFQANRQTVYTIKEKWGANISDHWPIKGTNGTTYDDGQRWDPSGSSEYSEVLVFLEIMPDHSFTLTVSEVNYDTFIMHYMVEALASETTGVTTYTYGGTTKRFKQAFVVEANYNYVTKAEDFFDVEGFTQWTSNPQFNGNSLDINGGGDVYFYYTRNSYALTFNDGFENVKTETVLYGDSWARFEDYVPEQPEQYEAGSREFAGWYWNPQGTNNQIVLSEETMPAENVIIYAKWELVDHEVTFYRSETDADKHGTTNAVTPLKPTFEVTHNELVPVANIPVTDPESDDCITPPEGMVGYEFDGWFYKDGDEKKPYTKEMPVTQDLVIYAKWKTTQVANFTVRYVFVDEDGNEIEVAETLEGKTIVGQNMTFDAKTGVDLYEEYRTKYFPTLYSSAITINADASKNVYTFYYTHRESVDYTVYYVEVSSYTENADGTVSFDVINSALLPAKTLQATTSFVAADFVPVVGYVAADGVYHKTLNIVAGAPSTDNGNYIADTYNAETNEGTHENIIVFYYFKDPTKSPYTIYHKVQNLDLSGFSEVEEDTIRGTGTNGTLYGDNLNVYENYEYLRAEVVYYENETTTKTETLDLNANVGWDISYRLPENGYGMTINIYYELSVGHLAITKNVVNTTDFAPMQDKFKITIELKDANGNVYTNAVKYQIGGGQEVEAPLNNGRFTVQLEAGETVLIKNLLHGTTYTVTEAAVTGFTTAITTTQDHNLVGAIDAGQTDTVVVKNTYYVGTLTVTKTVQGADAPKENGVFSDEFNFTLAVPGFAGLKVTFNGTERTLDGNGETTFTMKHGETVTINGIPDEADYTVTETANRDYTTKANDQPVYTVSDTMKAGNVATAAFVNTYKYSHLTIKKTGMEPGESAIFQVTGYSKYNNDEKVTFTISVPNNGEVTIGELLIGSDYTITEVGSWSNRYDAVTVPSGKIVEGGKTVVVTNGDKNQQWLHDEDYVHNDFSKPGSYGN